MGRRLFNLSESEQNALRLAEQKTHSQRDLKRLQAVRLYGSGATVDAVIEATGCSWRALMDWCRLYRAHGIDGLRSKWQGNNALKLSRSQRADLKRRVHSHKPDTVIPAELRVSRGQIWTPSDLKIAILKWYGVTYRSMDSYVALLHECDLDNPG